MDKRSIDRERLTDHNRSVIVSNWMSNPYNDRLNDHYINGIVSLWINKQINNKIYNDKNNC